MSKPFHIVIHPAPFRESTFEEVHIDGGRVRSMQCKELTETFDCSFEDVAQAFEQLPRMFLEPDGSFVWVTKSDGSRYQLDGSLVDDGTRLLSVELKGTCNEEVLEEFLGAIGWPDKRLLFQLIQRGIYISEGEFRHAFVAR